MNDRKPLYDPRQMPAVQMLKEPIMEYMQEMDGPGHIVLVTLREIAEHIGAPLTRTYYAVKSLQEEGKLKMLKHGVYAIGGR